MANSIAFAADLAIREPSDWAATILLEVRREPAEECASA
jgi:hypothetical protein